LLFGCKERSFPGISVPKQSSGTRSGVELGHDGGREFGAFGVTGFLHRPLQGDVGKKQGRQCSTALVGKLGRKNVQIV